MHAADANFIRLVVGMSIICHWNFTTPAKELNSLRLAPRCSEHLSSIIILYAKCLLVLQLCNNPNKLIEGKVSKVKHMM